MKNIFAITVILAFIFASGHLLNGNIQADQEPKSIKAEQIASQPSPTIIKAKPGSRLTGSPKINSIKMVDFYLRNGQSARFIETQGPHPVAGQLIFGKLISEDKNKVIVERLVEGKIILSTYSKRDIDTRTLHITTMPEYKYYLELGEYFYSRTYGSDKIICTTYAFFPKCFKFFVNMIFYFFFYLIKPAYFFSLHFSANEVN